MGVRLEPVGPLPPSTYWRRRAVLLAALVLLLLVLTKACSGGGDGGSESLEVTPSAAPTSTSSTTAVPVPTVTPTVTPTPTVTVAPVACTPAGGLRITAVADRKSYPLGTTARLTLTITNAGPLPCVVGLGQGSLEFRVASGDDRIWSSDDCSPGGAPGPAVLAPGEKRAAALSWSLTRSAPGCTGGRAALKPGTYVLAARTGTTNSDKFSFRVTPAA